MDRVYLFCGLALVLLGFLLFLRVHFASVATREAQRHLQQAALVLQHMPGSVVITDAGGRIESVNPAFEKNTGYRLDELAGRSSRLLRSPRHDPWFYRRIRESLRTTGRWEGEVWIRRKDGKIHPEWLSINTLVDARSRVKNYVGILSAVATHEAFKRRLHHLAYYDELTHLPNRQLFRDRLDLALAQGRRTGQGLAVMFVDLDRFKHVNDTLGHRMGDRILQATAERIKIAVRESDTLARVGGDEFTIILPGIVAPFAAANVARKVLRVLEPPFTLQGREFYISASIGISIYPDDGRTRESLIRNADIAMYRAKDLGRNNYQMYMEQMSHHVRRRLRLESELRRALDRDELFLLYQPQIELKTGRMIGVEALARWRHPTLGTVPPATFIPIAEETGLIDPIGEWVLRRACKEARPWTGTRGFRVAVNVSARQLHRSGFADMVAGVLEHCSMSADRLALELTESVTAERSPSQGTTLKALSDMGVQITIDDFGTGYSSLSYLKQFAVDKLKIDQSFVRDIPQDSNDRALASMIIAMAHASGMRVTAEGVETSEQLEFLRGQGCDEVQGFLISAPLSPGKVDRMCERDLRYA